MPAALLAATVTVQVSLCQQDRCGNVTRPAVGVRPPVQIPLRDFETSYDADGPAEATVVLLGGREVGGAALARQQDDFDFDVSYPNGEGCPPEVLTHTVEVMASVG